MRSIVRILSCLALTLTLAAPALQAAPKDKPKDTKKPTTEKTKPAASEEKAQWSLGLLGGLSIPTGDLAVNPGGQSVGFQGTLLAEVALSDWAFSLETGLAFLPNQPEIADLSPLRIVGTDLNAKWNFAPGDVAFYLLLGTGLDTQSFTATTSGGDVTVSTTDFMLRSGLGASFHMGASDAIVVEALYQYILSDPGASLFPIRIGYLVGL